MGKAETWGGGIVTNDQCATDGRDQLTAASATIKNADEPDDWQILDLLVNLMHLCDRDKIDFKDILRRARNNHEAEVREEKQHRKPGEVDP